MSSSGARRSTSIGGYRPGLAEDLETSLALHAAGWQSRYVVEPLAPGLAPATLVGFFTQQLKWSRGVFEAAIGSVRRGTFFDLSGWQKLAYLVRFSYYLVGPLFVLGQLLFAWLLISPNPALEGLLWWLLPALAAPAGLRVYMLRRFGAEPLARRGLHFRGASLVAVA